MKKLTVVLSIIFLCLLAGTMASPRKASARVSISKTRRQCSTYQKARKHMKRISFKVWDIKGRKKVTKTKTILIHKAIAKKVKKAFQAIYRSKEKFPIHTVGGFEWRGSNQSLHSLGLAVDINPDENYMVDRGKVMAGRLWKPGKNPYSIPKRGIVAKKMKKYGMKQCLWGKRKDYMHFSVGGY